MTDQQPPIDPLMALKQIRILLHVASESGDLDAIEKHVAMAQAIINKALPRKKKTLGT